MQEGEREDGGGREGRNREMERRGGKGMLLACFTPGQTEYATPSDTCPLHLSNLDYLNKGKIWIHFSMAELPIPY